MMGANPSPPAAFKDRGIHIGLFRGARSFAVTPDGFLTGRIFTEYTWKPGDNEAVCLNRSPSFDRPHDMSSGCMHGFYAYVDGSDDFHRASDVSGVILGYGEMLLGSRGFRSMGARILGLTIDKGVRYSLHAKVLSNYRGIPFFPSFEALVLAFPPTIDLARPAEGMSA